MIKVLKPGLNTSIQDLGRFGYRNSGVPNSGCMDLISAGFANLLLNNALDRAVLEITLMGPKLLFLTNATLVVTGADLSPKINNRPIVNYKPIKIESGDILSFGKPVKGVRSYLAVKGGIRSELKLKSRSQFKSITTNNRLLKNDVIDIKEDSTSFKAPAGKLKMNFQFFETDVLEVTEGPEFKLLSKKDIDQLAQEVFTISKLNNRMGYQLEEKMSSHKLSIITSPVLPGTVQLTPSGRLIVLMLDSQTTGGYPRVLQLTELSISILAQKTEGDSFKMKLSRTVE